jgi:3' terminal RNA ribose 2'-O-methyltransferase Hen1
MLLKISTTHHPATDLGYLLHKHPDKFQSVELSVGQAHVFYPEANADRTTACLLLEIDPIGLVRSGKHMQGEGFALGQYVNDRPYVASSFMSVAIAKAFSSALNGRCKDRPELLGVSFPFEVDIEVVAAPRGGEILIRKFFEPLGYVVNLKHHILDARFPEWGESKYYSLRLEHSLPLMDLLRHLYVLLPALDNDKHYFVSEKEIEILLEKGEGWLKSHPEREQITRRFLANLGSLTRDALERLSEGEVVDPEADEVDDAAKNREARITLHDKRIQAVAEKLKESGAQTVVDLGCGEGKLIRQLLKEKQFSKIVGMDVSYVELMRAKERLHYDEMAPKQKERLQLFQGSLTYRDARLSGFDAAAVVEVIEHLEPNRLKAFERVLFEFAKPKTIVLTTPNQEFNATFENMDEGAMRHDDHRFEWTRSEFEGWANRVARAYNYAVAFFPIGDAVAGVGSPSQMAVFTYGN